MRKTSYAITLVVVAATLILTIVSTRRNDWIVVKGTDIFTRRVTVQYGLMERCERQILELPGPSDGGKIEYTDFSCRPFPASVTDRCEKNNRHFCTAWTSAAYVAELGVGFGALAVLSVIFGVSTHSRRRRIWRVTAGLTALHAIFTMITFAVVTDQYRTSRYVGFLYARYGPSYYANIVAWVAATLATFGVIITGISSDKGHRWAAGNRSYAPIEG